MPSRSREITGGLAAGEGKLRHLGVDLPPKRSTLAYANQHRPWQLFETVFHPFYERSALAYANQHRPWQLFETVFHPFYERCRAEAACHGRRKFRFRHNRLSLDATMIPLCLSVFDGALYRRSKAP